MLTCAPECVRAHTHTHTHTHTAGSALSIPSWFALYPFILTVYILTVYIYTDYIYPFIYPLHWQTVQRPVSVVQAGVTGVLGRAPLQVINTSGNDWGRVRAGSAKACNDWCIQFFPQWAIQHLPQAGHQRYKCQRQSLSQTCLHDSWEHKVRSRKNLGFIYLFWDIGELPSSELQS